MPESKPVSGKPESSSSAASPQPASSGRGRWVWGAILVVVLVGGGLWLHNRPAAKAQSARSGGGPPVVPIGTSVVRKGDIGVYVDALGAVTPVYTVMVKSRVDGQLMSVDYVEGQMVHEGDSLATIDPRPYQAQLTQAEGQLARDKALLENARLDLDRYQLAYSKNAIPKQQLDTQVATVHQYEGAVKVDEGQVDNARLQVTYSHITAPITGRVGLRLVDPGNIVHANDTNPLAVITQIQPITVVFSVAEDYLPAIQEQLAAGHTLSVEAYDRTQQKRIATGTLLTLDNQIDVTTGTIKLKAQFPNDDNALFPNQFVNARLLISTDHDVTLVPSSALQRNALGAFVYIVQSNQTVAMRPVTPGATDGKVIAVSGVDPGEVIAADNFNRLQEGAKVGPRQSSADGGGKGGGGHRTNSPSAKIMGS